MYTFEITIHRKYQEHWPVVVRYQASPTALTVWASGECNLDLAELELLLPSDEAYSKLIGKNLFRKEIRDAFVRALSETKATSEPLRVLLIIEAEELRSLHWEQLCAPFEGGRWDYLLLNQQTPFSLYLPSQIERRFPPIGRRDLRVLLLVSGPEELDGDYGLPPFDVPATVDSIKASLGEIPCDVLASSIEAAVGEPRLDSLCERLTVERYTILHIICHGAHKPDIDETILYLPKDDQRSPVTSSELIERFNRLNPVHGLPHFTFLSTCESADPQAESGLGGLGQRLVRELGMPAVLAMTSRVSIRTAQALAESFYSRLDVHGEVDAALAEALVGLQGRFDTTVPALFSRLGGRPLFSDALDRPLTEAEIIYGLEQLNDLIKHRAPILHKDIVKQSQIIQATLGVDGTTISVKARHERETALATINQLSVEALDLSFNALALGQKPLDYDDRCPFRGLYPFREEDREFFFGRQALVKTLSDRLLEHRFLAVLGPSGCGKSSLVLAGVVPDLDLPVAYLTPGRHPLAKLEAVLNSIQPDNLVVVDQFEELFTLCKDENERQTFIARLLELPGTQYVVITMRADFLGECAYYPELREKMENYQKLIAPMGATRLRRAMERQADLVGLRFEVGLGEAILDDVQDEPGAMPLLQHALLLLWQRRHGQWLRWEEYRSFGGIREAIATTADEVYIELGDHEQERMRDIFLRLTRLEDGRSPGEVRDTSRRVELAELIPVGSDPADTVMLVKHLADTHLIVTSVIPANGVEEVDVAHEALIRHWPRLRDWLEEDRAWLRLREGVREAALEWEAHKQDDNYLVHRAGRLEDAMQLMVQPRFSLYDLEQGYLHACTELQNREQLEKEEQQRRELEAARKLAEEQKTRAEEQAIATAKMRKRALIIAAVGAVAILMAIFAIFYFIQARGNAETANNNAATATANLATAEAASTLAVANAEKASNNAATATANLATAEAASTLAVANAEEAQQQANIARTRELAALALSQLDRKLDLGLLMSIEAFRKEDLSQTRQALFSAWSHNPQLSRFLLGYYDSVYSMAWLPDDQLVSGYYDGTVIVWDLESGQPERILKGHSGQVSSVAWSQDGQLASGSEDGTVIVWDIANGEPERILVEHSEKVWSVAWSPDGQLASSSSDGTVIVWDMESGKPEMTLEGHYKPVTSIAWSQDGRLASGSSDGNVIVWNLGEVRPELILVEHSGLVSSVAWSLDGQLASCSESEDDTVIVWDLESDQPELILEEHSDGVTSVAWSPDGQLASGSWDNTVIIWDLEGGQPKLTLEGHSDGVTSIAWSPDGQLASGSFDGAIIVWDPEKDQPELTLEGRSWVVTSVAWSQDGKLASGSYNGTVIVWDLGKSQPELTLDGHSELVSSMAWSPDRQLASGSWDNTVIIWDLESSQPKLTLEGHSYGVTSIAWSPDGQLASGSYNGTVIVWDLGKSQPELTLEGHSELVSSMAWSPDGELASVFSDGTIIVWDLEDNQPELTLEGHSGRNWSVAWSPDVQLASSPYDSSVILWDLENNQPKLTLEGHSESVTCMAWSMEGRLASGSSDGTVIVWDLESGQPELLLEGHSREDRITTVAWSLDGQLASVATDNTIQVWQTNPNVLANQLCQRAGRNLTQNEWTLYFSGEDYHKTCEQYPPHPSVTSIQ